MRVLLIEDNVDFAQQVERSILQIPDCDDLVWTRSRNGALRRLETSSFDLVILDRKLPSEDDVLDDQVDHGWSVFQWIREHSAGTPVWFLTGTEDPDFATDINNDYGRFADLHGRGVPEQMYRVFWKKRITECIREIRAFAAQRKSLEGIAVTQPVSLQLNENEMLALRIYSRRYNGATAQVDSLNGGLSNSRVLKVRVMRADQSIVATAAAKISTLTVMKEEERKYQEHILRLRPGGFPQLAVSVEVGAGNTGGLFYGMVGDSVESLFDRIASGHASVPQVPASLSVILRPWYQAHRDVQVSIGQIRRRFLGDTKLHERRAELKGIDVNNIEGRVITASSCCQHGDFHCANVVFDDRGQAMVIDFGDAGPSYSAVDPVTLELSTVFHSQHSVLPGEWPTEENLLDWPNIEKYLAGCPYAEFVRACRTWALADAGSPEETVAVAYSYAMRQLKYADTNKPFARALIRGCFRHF